MMIVGKRPDCVEPGGKRHAVGRTDHETGPTARRIGYMVAQLVHGGEAVPFMDQACSQRHAPRNALARTLLPRRYSIFPDFGENGAPKGRSEKRREGETG